MRRGLARLRNIFFFQNLATKKIPTTPAGVFVCDHAGLEINEFSRWQAKNFVGRAVAYGDIIKLRHTKSKALLGIDIGRAPKLEPSAKRVVLHTRDSAPVRFRITPRFKSLAEGNNVCYGDSIALVSVDYPTTHTLTHAHTHARTHTHSHTHTLKHSGRLPDGEPACV